MQSSQFLSARPYFVPLWSPSLYSRSHRLGWPCRVSFGLVLEARLLAGVLPAFAATLTVTNTNDSRADSLRNAIAMASSSDTIQFSLPNPRTITLTIKSTLIVSNSGAERGRIREADRKLSGAADAGWQPVCVRYVGRAAWSSRMRSNPKSPNRSWAWVIGRNLDPVKTLQDVARTVA